MFVVKEKLQLAVGTLAQVRSWARGGSGRGTEAVVSAIALGFPQAGIGCKWLLHTLLGR